MINIQTVDKKAIKAKAFVMDTIMRHPKLSKTIAEAWDAPVGSTKRARAKSVMRSLHKTHNNYSYVMDGMGGGGTTLSNNPLADLINRQTNPSFNQMFVLDSSGRLISTNPAINSTPANTPATSLTPSSPNVFLKTIDNYITDQDVAYQPSFGLVSTPKEPALNTGLNMGINPKTGKMEGLRPGFTVKDMEDAGLWSKPAEHRTIAATNLAAPIATKKATLYGPSGTKPEIVDIGSARASELQSQGWGLTPGSYKARGTTGPPGVAGAIISNPQGLTMEQANDPKYWKDGKYIGTDQRSLAEQALEAAYASGVGPTAFALGILNDRQKLAQFSGVPDSVLAEIFPAKGGLLNSQLAALFEAEKKDHNLDSLAQQLVQAANRNLDIESNLQAYIRGKDEYLGDIDRMIEKGKEISAYTDTSNPYAAKQISNYMNYLTVLQGRQNSRYINMLDLAIKSDNNKYQQLTNTYTLISQQVQQDYTSRANITTEFYNNTKDALTEMYNNVGERADIAQKNEKYEMDILNSTLDIAKKEIELQIAQKKLDSGTDIYEKVSKADLDAMDLLMGFNVDSDTGDMTLSDYNPLSAVDSTSSQKVNPAFAIKRYGTLAGQYMQQVGATGNFKGELDKFDPYLTEMMKVYTAGNTENGYAEIIAAMTSGLTSGVKTYLLSKVDRIREAIKSLTGEGWFKGKQTNRDSFIKDFADLGDIAALLFDDQFKLEEKNMTLNDMLKLDDASLINQLASPLASLAIENPQ